MVNVHDIPIQIATIRLPSVGLCGVLAPSDFLSFLPSEEASWWLQMLY